MTTYGYAGGPATGPDDTVDAAHRAGSRFGAAVVLLLLLAGVVVWALDLFGVVRVELGVALAIGLTVAGATLLLLSFDRGTHVALTLLGLLLATATVLVALVPAVADAPVSDALGVRTERPATPADLDGAAMAVGTLELDLTGTEVAPTRGAAPPQVMATVGLGALRVRLPDDVAVLVRGTAGLGQVRVVDDTASGLTVTDVYVSPDFATAPRRLTLDLRVGLGEVEVTR